MSDDGQCGMSLMSTEGANVLIEDCGFADEHDGPHSWEEESDDH